MDSTSEPTDPHGDALIQGLTTGEVTLDDGNYQAQLSWQAFEADLEGSLSPQRRGSFKCECGLFAKFLRERHYYNGQFDCYSYTVQCARCGEVTVECV